jgi:hypothetical protein
MSRLHVTQALCLLLSRWAGTKSDVLAALAKLLAENGKEIRAAALKSLEVAYEFQGEGTHVLCCNSLHLPNHVTTAAVSCLMCLAEHHMHPVPKPRATMLCYQRNS